MRRKKGEGSKEEGGKKRRRGWRKDIFIDWFIPLKGWFVCLNCPRRHSPRTLGDWRPRGQRGGRSSHTSQKKEKMSFIPWDQTVKLFSAAPPPRRARGGPRSCLISSLVPGRG